MVSSMASKTKKVIINKFLIASAQCPINENKN
jgi:hypothetical protein